MKKIIIILSAVILTALSQPLAEKSPLNDSYFIGETPDAAAIGMGEAYTGMRANPFAPFWNPAGLVTVKRSYLGISLNTYTDTELDSDMVENSFPLEGKKLNYVSVCGEQVGFFWRAVSNRIDVTSGTVAGVKYEERIDEKINMMGISVAVPHSDIVDFGMNINFYSGMLGYYVLEGSTATIYVSDGIGWGLDWGLLYKMNPNITFGITVLNFPAMIYWEDFEQDKFPVIFRGGVSLRLSHLMSVGIDYENGDYDDSVNAKDLLHFGIQQHITSSVVVRAGMYGKDLNDKYSVVYTSGLGFLKEGYNIDIAGKSYYLDNNKSGKITRLSLSGVIPF